MAFPRIQVFARLLHSIEIYYRYENSKSILLPIKDKKFQCYVFSNLFPVHKSELNKSFPSMRTCDNMNLLFFVQCCQETLARIQPTVFEI